MGHGPSKPLCGFAHVHALRQCLVPSQKNKGYVWFAIMLYYTVILRYSNITLM